jgi:hypothetical protein
MSFCPYGGEAAAELAALQRALGKSLAVEVRYVVRETDGDPSAPRPPVLDRPLTGAGERCVDEGEAGAAPAGEAGADSPGAGSPEEMALTRGFSSLHGPAEVLENLRQIALAAEAPERLLDYIAVRAADPGGDWRAVARGLGIDPERVAAGLPAARERLRADAERGRALGVAASPTLRLNGAPLALDFARDAVGRAACGSLPAPPAACGEIPRCVTAADCRDPGRPGTEGRCEHPGRPDARCGYVPAPPVVLHVLNDPECAPCNPTPVVAGARELFPGLTTSAYDVTRGEGRQWIAAHRITSVPAYVFAGAESSAGFPAIASLLAPIDAASPPAGRLLDPEVLPGPLFFARPPEPGTIDLFLDATGPATLGTLRTLAALRDSTAFGPALRAATIRLHHVLDHGPVAEGPRAAGQNALRLVQRGAEAHVIPPGTPEFQSRLGAEDLAEARRQACIALHGGPVVVEYLMDRARAGEVGPGDWRGRVERLGLDPARIGYCAGSGAADPQLEADRQLAAELHARPPAVLVSNRLRLDGLGPWNATTFVQALGSRDPSTGDPSTIEGGTAP